MSELTVEDFKNVLLDLYLAQRESADLRLKLTEALKQVNVAEETPSEEV